MSDTPNPPRKGSLADDPRGLLYEAYRIEGIGPSDCRTIFLDWALGLPAERAAEAAIEAALAAYAEDHPDHPMTAVLREGLHPPQRRRRRRRSE